jgi:predicted DsbA family dithiol-disulfide isomerase
MDIEIWSDVVCPWCYLGKRHVEQALQDFEHADRINVTYRSFELDPSAPRGATTATVDMLASKYGMSPDEAADAQRQMERRAELAGLEFHLGDLRSGNTRDAHRLIHLAKEHDVQPALVERLHRAYFTEQRSIVDPATLVELAGEVGLDTAEALGVLESNAYDSAVEADEELARSIGVNGVPFFVIDRHFAVSGAQPADVITRSLEHAWAEAARTNA